MSEENCCENTQCSEQIESGLPGDLSILETAIGYQFKDRSKLIRALTHRSVTGNTNRSDYERLEFLGDAVLDLAVAQLLLDYHINAREGELSKMRAALVNTSSLAEVGKNISLGQYIRLSKGEFANGGAERPSILADVVEALVGAVYRDSCYEQAFELVKKLFGDSVSTVNPRDPKTELQEALHVLGINNPEYLLEIVEGPEHAPTFISVVQVEGEILGRGKGGTKKESQQFAAAEALTKLKNQADE